MHNERNDTKACHRSYLIAAIAILAGCATSDVTAMQQDEPSTIAAPTVEAGSYCKTVASQPNYRLWSGVDETTRITTFVREFDGGEKRYCIRFEIDGDPEVTSGEGCASTPDLAVASFANEFQAYLCGVSAE